MLNPLLNPIRLVEVILAEEDRHCGVALGQAELVAAQGNAALALALVEGGAGLRVVGQELQEGGLADAEERRALLGRALDVAQPLQRLERRLVGLELGRSLRPAAFIAR